MSESDNIVHRCVALSGVPSDCGEEDLRAFIREKIDISPVQLHLVPGGEADQRLERWVVLLNSDKEASELRDNIKQHDLKYNGNDYLVQFLQSIPCEVPIDWKKETHGDPAPPVPEKPSLEGQGPFPQHHQFAASGFYHNMPGSGGPGTEYQPMMGPPISQPAFFPPYQMGQERFPSNRFPRPSGQNQHGFGPFPGMFDQRTGQWIPFLPPGMNPRAPYFQGIFSPGHQQPQQSLDSVGDPPPYSTEMGSDDHHSHMSNTEHKGFYLPDQAERDSRGQPSPVPSKILLKNLPSFVDEDYLEMLFEGKKLNVGSVSSVQLSEDGTEAVVEFADPQSVDKVMEKRPIDLKGHTLEVEVYDPNKTAEDMEEVQEEQPPAKLVVSNLPENVDEEFLEMFFENKKKFGEELEVENIELIREEGKAIVEFADPEAMQVVLERHSSQTLNIMGSELQLEEFVPEVIRDPSEDLRGGEGEAVKILVTNIPASAMEEDFLGMTFENKKFGYQAVKSVELYEEYSAALIEFEDPKAVPAVMKKKPITIRKEEVQVWEYNPKIDPLETVEVHGDFSEDDKEILEMYFENKKKSGGDSFESLDVEEGGKVAYIKYKTEEVAKKVVDRKKHKVGKHLLSVQLFKPPDPLEQFLKEMFAAEQEQPLAEKEKDTGKRGRKDKVQAKAQGDKEPEPKVTTCVKVRGVKKVRSEETVQYYFESRKSGGGPIKEIKIDSEDENIMFITFESEEVAKAVSERGNHQVEGCELSVSLYIPPPPRPVYEDKLLIKGLKPTTTKDCLFNFLEAKSKGNVPMEQQHGEKEGVRLVTFEKNIDFEELQKKVEKLEGADLSIEKVYVSNCIYVSNYDETLGKDTLELYFENVGRSGGGRVQKVKFNEEEGYWLVYFEDYSVIDNVLSHEHTLGGQKLEVKLFVECLGQPQGGEGGPVAKLPDPIIMQDLHPQKVKFILNSPVSKNAFEKQMETAYAKIHWPPKGVKSDIELKLECTLTRKTKNFYKLAKEWKQTAMDNFQAFFNTITVSDLPFNKDLWTEVRKSLEEITISNPDAVAVFVEKDQGMVTIAGMKKPLEQLAADIKQKIAKIEEEDSLAKQRTKESLTTVKLLYTKMLLAVKFPSRMEEKYKDFKLKINQNKNEITFEGINSDISAVKLEMFELNNSFSLKVFADIPKQSMEMYLLKQVKDYIVKRLKEKNVSAVWDANESRLTICSTCDQALAVSSDIIKDAVKEQAIPLTPANRSVTSTDAWDDLVNDFHARYPGRVMIAIVNMTKIVVTATDDLVTEISEGIKKFLSSNAILNDEMKLLSSVTRLLSQHHRDEVDAIAKSLVSDHVQISWASTGFNIRGNERGVKNAKTHLHSLAAKVQTKDISITKPGLGSYLASPNGQESMRSLENNLPCVVTVKGQEDLGFLGDEDSNKSPRATALQGPHLSPDMRQYAYCPTPDDRKIYTAQGDMTDMNVDVLVNTSDKKMKLVAGLGKAILTKGGQEIKSACENYIQQYGVLEEGEVFMSSGGALKARHVIHVAGPAWQDGQQREKERLKDAVTKLLKQVSMRNLKSLAIPAISCGTFGFPAKVATSVIVQAVQNFFREEQDTSIEFVYLCDVNISTVEAFTEALKNCFGRVKLSPVKNFKPQKPSPTKNKPKFGVPVLPQPTPAPRQRAPGTKIVIGKIRVTIVKGELAKEKVNAVVNTTADSLDLTNGAVSKSLLDTAGPELQNEVKANHPNKLPFGDIVITKGYQLNCEIVMHTALQNYDGGPAIQTLQTVMDKCLTEANNRQFTAIAFPAIGTGNLKFPKDIVAKEMFTAIETFTKSNPNNSLRDVKFVVYHKDTATVKAFEDEEGRWTSGSRVVGPSGSRVVRQSRSARDFDLQYPQASEAMEEESDKPV